MVGHREREHAYYYYYYQRSLLFNMYSDSLITSSLFAVCVCVLFYRTECLRKCFYNGLLAFRNQFLS